MSAPSRFAARVISAIDAVKIVGVRAGTTHRYTAVWVVVVEGRVFVRSWSDQPTGWYRAFLERPAGSIQFGETERKVLARPTRSGRLRQAVSGAYSVKYATKGSQKWVRGFAQAERAANTLEFVPRS